MQSLFSLLGYVIYFCDNGSREPVHIHVSNGEMVEGSTKFWLTLNNGVVLRDNTSEIPESDLEKIKYFISLNVEFILDRYFDNNDTISYYC
jgi:hypothetical protein